MLNNFAALALGQCACVGFCTSKELNTGFCLYATIINVTLNMAPSIKLQRIKPFMIQKIRLLLLCQQWPGSFQSLKEKLSLIHI